MARCALTTTDNPYDPFTQFDAWYRFDDIIKYSPLKIYKKVQADFTPEPAVTQ